MSKQCSFKTCISKAKFEVIFFFKVTPDHSPAESDPIVVCCKKHADLKWDDFYTDKWWKSVCVSFFLKGMAAPSKEHSYLEVRNIKTKIKSEVKP